MTVLSSVSPDDSLYEWLGRKVQRSQTGKVPQITVDKKQWVVEIQPSCGTLKSGSHLEDHGRGSALYPKL